MNNITPIATGKQQTTDREHLSYFIDEVKVLSEEMQTKLIY